MPKIHPHRLMALLFGAVLLAGPVGNANAADDDELIGRIVGEGGVFDFTKLNDQGQPLSDQDAVYTIEPWSCLRDNVTGLVWEVKTTDGGLRDQNNTYTWHNPDADENGGAPGPGDGGECSGSACGTHAYVQAVNERGLCGATDWRMPTRAELRTIVDYQATFPAIRTDYFPNTVATSFWSSEPNANYPNFAWHTDFKFGLASYYYLKSGPKAVRLVRDVDNGG
ncbi:MAG: DUF1566 domain-containing protein [Halofilum sp. (in: g-proteobacteria)]|nr:DUF1566 domain-containing protein [Halofilum sp. (in: g-proteobacteria)]